jgi:hypothetical protein
MSTSPSLSRENLQFYSTVVGKTILWTIKATGIMEKNVPGDFVMSLATVAIALTRDSVSRRMSLEEAEKRLQSKLAEGSLHGQNLEMLQNELSVSNCKVERAMDSE